MPTFKYSLSFAFVVAFVLLSFAPSAFGQLRSDRQAPAEILPAREVVRPFAPGGIQFSGNPNCNTLDMESGLEYEHITGKWEIKFDPPNGAVSAPMTSNLIGGMPANPNMFLSYYMNPAGTAITSWNLSWTSLGSVNRFVSAVIVKGGSRGANVYLYPNLSSGDTGPFTVPTGQEISHISFCFEPTLAPSAAPASVSGRAATSRGAAIAGALVMIQNLQTGESKTVRTNNFGHYEFRGLEVSAFYVMTISHQRYAFADGVRTFTLNEQIDNEDFVASN